MMVNPDFMTVLVSSLTQWIPTVSCGDKVAEGQSATGFPKSIPHNGTC